MKAFLKPTIPFLLSTTLTGIGCHLAGMPRPDLIVAIVVAAIVSGSVAYGTAFVHSHRIH